MISYYQASWRTNGPIHVSLRIGLGLYVSALTRCFLVFLTIVSHSRSNIITESVVFLLKKTETPLEHLSQYPRPDSQ